MHFTMKQVIHRIIIRNTHPKGQRQRQANDKILHTLAPLLLNEQMEQNLKRVPQFWVKFHYTTYICEYNLGYKNLNWQPEN